MQRRKFIFGSTAAGAGLLFGTGAFSATGTAHGVSIQAGDSDLHVEFNDEYEGDAEAYVTEDPLALEFEVGDNEWIRFDDLLRVTNTGTQSVVVYVEDQEWLGDDADAVLDYRVDGSVVGEDNGITLEDTTGDNSETLTILVDVTGHDTVEDALSDTDGDDISTVRFVAESTDADSGTGEEESDEGDDGEDEDEKPGDDEDGYHLKVDAADSVTVGSDTTFDVTATVEDAGHGGGEATVTLDIEGDQLDPHEETITVSEDGESDATFEIQTVYDDLEEDNTEFGRHGDFRFDGTDWTVTIDYAGETDDVGGTLEVEDAAIEWYSPDGDKKCPVCNMMTEMFDGWHAQVTHVDGTRTEFCSTGCVVSYVVDYQQYDGLHMDLPEAEIEGVWVVDFTERQTTSGTDLIDAHDAYFVLDYGTGNKFATPMSGSPPAFASKSDAEAYVNGELDELEDVDMSNVSEDDIVTIDEFDDEIANEYRGQYFDS